MKAEQIEVNSIGESSTAVTVRGIRILRTVKAGRRYFLIEDYATGKRRLLNAPTLARAKERARELADAIASNRREAVKVDDHRLRQLQEADDLAKSHGKPVEFAIHEWAEAVALLKGKATLLDAVRFYLGNRGPDLSPRTVKDAVVELLALKKAQGMSTSHTASTKYRLGKFSKVFGESELHTLTVAQIENFILGLNQGPRSQNHFKKSVANLFVFAQTRLYVAKDFNPAREVRSATVPDTEVEHFDPEQVKKLIAACTGDMEDHLPFVLLGAFAGLRPTEAVRVTWQMIGQTHIKLPGKINGQRITKTGKSRIIPLLPNLAQWLQPLREKAGLVVSPSVNFEKAPAKLTEASGVVWIPDGLRHSYGSFRQAVIKNIAQVSDELGNGIGICKKHYVSALLTAEQGEAWFSIAPEQVTNVTQMPAEATA